ncbi:low molecular weight protein-tyrosine-phosphatase [Flagellimonas nanhaiensis]|uniref:protein-tyrosine-phosphatase n=1 Tax=Flagellimonas nanhaiensis TaxID=2292706 RepID=A0A371JU36_9FLAO|nr:low molecular weight protein-tyrosine-phosphatase [Allomuricauda nanhaiensis]RDY61305.1 low molecular weight phosphotyrosine protein phosphatase [Allomuricauda nanhaiensis]
MKTKVLMVCLGNICRSPLAEGILKSMVDPNKVLVDSAGTAGYHVGNPPDNRSIIVARKYGIDISAQQCRKFSEIDFLEFDHIYAMDRSNLSNIMKLAQTEKEAEKVRLLLDEVDLGLKEVPDPYYGGDDGFEKVYQLIEKACLSIAEKLN